MNYLLNKALPIIENKSDVKKGVNEFGEYTVRTEFIKLPKAKTLYDNQEPKSPINGNNKTNKFNNNFDDKQEEKTLNYKEIYKAQNRYELQKVLFLCF